MCAVQVRKGFNGASGRHVQCTCWLSIRSSTCPAARPPYFPPVALLCFGTRRQTLRTTRLDTSYLWWGFYARESLAASHLHTGSATGRVFEVFVRCAQRSGAQARAGGTDRRRPPRARALSAAQRAPSTPPIACALTARPRRPPWDRPNASGVQRAPPGSWPGGRRATRAG